jgi:hypothetical protein
MLRVLTKANFPSDTSGLRSSTFYYFFAAGLISASGLVAHEWIIPRLDVRQPQLTVQAGGLELSYRHPAPDQQSLLLHPGPSLPESRPINNHRANFGGRFQSQGVHERVFVINDDDDEDQPAVLLPEGGQLHDGVRADEETEDFDEPITQV